MKTNYQVTIQEVENGYVVRVGCKMLVFTDYETLQKEQVAYFAGEKTELSSRLMKNESATACVEAPIDPSGGLATQTI